MSLPETFRRHITIPPDQLVLVEPGESVPLCSMERGIVFILAKWSGQSQLAFRALNKALAQTEGFADLPVYIADTDSAMTQEFLAQIGETPSGGGETYWVVGGRIQHKLRGYTDKDLSSLVTFTKELAHPVLLANGDGKRGVGTERETEAAS